MGWHFRQATRPVVSSTRWASMAAVLINRPPLAGPLHAADDLVPGERLGHPLRLATIKMTDSCVVNRRPHSGHDLRRRIAVPSSATRLSMTLLSDDGRTGSTRDHLLTWLATSYPYPLRLSTSCGEPPAVSTRCCGQR